MPEHENITADADNHEPMGLSSLTGGTSDAKKVYHSDGAGSGSWTRANPHGSWRYTAIGTGTTFTTPSTYTLMNVVGAGTHLTDFTENSLGRLTYTGTNDAHCHSVCDITLKHSTGSGQDIFFDVYKNGVSISAENAITADSGNYQHIALHWDVVLSTNDYVEVYLKTASGNVIIHEAYMFAMGMPA